jgi:hypothetical protein
MNIEKYLYETADIDTETKDYIEYEINKYCVESYMIKHIGVKLENPSIYIIIVQDISYDTYSVWEYDTVNKNILFNGIYDTDFETASRFFLNCVES